MSDTVGIHPGSFLAKATLDELREVCQRQADELVRKSEHVRELIRDGNEARHMFDARIGALVEHAKVNGYPLADADLRKQVDHLEHVAAIHLRHADAAETYRATLCTWPVQARTRQKAAGEAGVKVDTDLLELLLTAIDRANTKFTKAIDGRRTP